MEIITSILESSPEFKVARWQNSEVVEMFIVMLIPFPVYLFLIQFCFPDLSSPLYFSFKKTPCLRHFQSNQRSRRTATQDLKNQRSTLHIAACFNIEPQLLQANDFSTKTLAMFGSSGNFPKDLAFGCCRLGWGM